MLIDQVGFFFATDNTPTFSNICLALVTDRNSPDTLQSFLWTITEPIGYILVCLISILRLDVAIVRLLQHQLGFLWQNLIVLLGSHFFRQCCTKVLLLKRNFTAQGTWGLRQNLEGLVFEFLTWQERCRELFAAQIFTLFKLARCSIWLLGGRMANLSGDLYSPILTAIVRWP